MVDTIYNIQFVLIGALYVYLIFFVRLWLRDFIKEEKLKKEKTYPTVAS